MNVDFIPSNNFVAKNITSPKPAKQYIPTWMKEIPAVSSVPTSVDNPKGCMPFLDSFTSGYIQELSCDIKISYRGEVDGRDSLLIEYNGERSPLSSREIDRGKKTLMPNFSEYYNSEQHWITSWEPHTPEGYSTLYTHPFNRIDLPFYTHSGIIETDKYPVSGPLPFLIKRGFEGVIEKGTPIYQMIFIKRDDWNHYKKEYDEEFLEKTIFQAKKYLKSGYKKVFWIKKIYE